MHSFTRRQRWRLVIAATGAVGAAAFVAAPVRGDVLYWDANGATAPNPAGGSGTWSATGANWWNGVGIQAYNAGVQPHDAIFGTAAGGVGISGTVTARSLTFDTHAYALSGGTLILADAGLVSVTNPADTTTVGSSVSGTMLTKTGAGTLVLSGTNAYTGLTVHSGTVSFSGGDHLGEVSSPVTVNGGALRFTGSTSLATPATRDFVVGHRGGTFDITNTSGSGLTIGGVLSGAGSLVKTGTGTLRLDSAAHLFAGGLTINGGTFRFNNNNEAGPQALRMNRVTFGAAGATLSLGGSGGSATGEGAELRTGEWNSGAGGAGTVIAATTTTDAEIGAHGHDLMIFALADANFSGTVGNLITSNGGVTGAASTHGELEVRGIATQTFSGTTNINNTIAVAHGAGLTLAGNAAITGAGIDLRLKGGRLILDNAAVNNANRVSDTATIETRGGGTFALIGNGGGSSETVGQLQLGDAATVRAGGVNVNVTHNADAAAATVLTFAGLQRDSGRATVDFSAQNSAGAPLALGQPGNGPRIVFNAAPATASGSGLLSGNGVGWATVNGCDFATHDTNGVAPVATTAFAVAGSTDNALLDATATISTTKSLASLKIAPAAPGQTLDLADSGDLDTSAMLLAGPTDFTIRNVGAGTGSLAGSTARHVYVQQAALTVGAKVTGAAPLVKSGTGTLVLAGTNDYTGVTTLNEGFLRATNGVSLGAGTLEMRGGVLEIAGGGTFNRHLDQGQGSAGTPGLISWNAVFGLGQTSNEDRGGGGFAAVGAEAVIDLNGLGATDLNWEEPSFLPSGYALVLGSPNANARIDLVDNYGFGLGVDAYNTREIRVIDNPASTADIARISGIIYSDTPANGGQLHDLVKSGEGVLELAGANTYYGGTVIAEGTIIAAHNNALGHGTAPYVMIGNRGGSASASLLAADGVTLARDITVQAGSSGAVTLGRDSGLGLSTFAGNIFVQRELNLAAASSGGTVEFTGALENTAGQTLTISGAGTVTLSGGQTHGVGATLIVLTGTLNLDSDAGGNLDVDARSTTNFGSSQRLAALSVSNGATATILAGGTGERLLTTDALSISGDATLDLRDNKLITNTPIGTFNSTAYSGIQGEVARAYNFGAWDQPGLMTSEELAGPNAGPLSGTTTIGVATGEQILFIAPTDSGVFAGQTITGATTIAMYTYAGDMNFDGLVDAADYGVIDNWVQFPGSDGYANGDLNYDGVIDAADYGIIDNTIQLQGAPIPVHAAPASLSGVTPVPEPAGAVLLLAPLAAAARHRRRRHSSGDERHALRRCVVER